MELLNAAVQKQLFEYWMKKMAVPAEWLADYLEEPEETPRLLSLDLTSNVMDQVRQVARNDISEYTLFFAVYSFLLYRYFGTNCLVTSPDLQLFPPAATDHLLCYTTGIREEKTLKEVLVDLQQEVMTVMDKRDVDMYACLEAAKNKGINTDHIQCFGFLHRKVNERTTLPDKTRLKLIIQEEEGKYELQLRVNGIKEGLLIGQQFISQYQYLLSNIRELLDKRIADIEILLPAATPRVPAPEESTVLDFFGRQVAQRPDHTALVSRGSSWTYAGLDAESNKLAAYLTSEEQVVKGHAVGLLLPRSEWIMTGILGILKTGAAFVPIDPAWPANRIQYILEDAGVQVLLTTTEYLPLLTAFKGNLFAFDIQQELLPPAATVPQTTISATDAAYIMYTSGTTGQPKGVIIDHKGVANYATWLHQEFNLDTAHAAVLITSYAFDLGYTSIWGTIPWGGTLHIPGEDYSRMPEKLRAYLSKEKISFIKVTPSLFHLLLNAGNSASQEAPLYLQWLFLGGEMIRPADIAAFLEQYPDTVFVNHYGPTESTVGCIFQKITRKELPAFSRRPVIGKPIRNTQVLILDEHQHVLPHGVWGEIAISGPGVAKAYLHKADITAQKFIAKKETATGRVYRTGDYGRYLENGTIELKGRKDNQAKIRGYRVELEEIEKCLVRFPGIQEAAVLLQRTEADQHTKLVAFYTVADREKEISGEAVLSFLKAYLPDYMVPADLIPITAMPVNENGKLNRKQLSATVADAGIKAHRKQVLPANEVEQTILQVWQKVLRREDISTADSFFELGGNSLLLVQVNIELNNFFPALTITDLFAYISIAALAAYINSTGPAAGVSLSGSALQLPPGYFNTGLPAGNVDEQSADLYVQLSSETANNIRAIAAATGVSVIDISVGAFTYALAKCAALAELPLHIAEEQNTIKRISIPVQSIASKEQLYSSVAAQRATPQQAFAAGSIIRPAATELMQYQVWPLVQAVATTTGTGIFDIILTVQDKHTQLAFSLQYAPRLSAEKMEALLEMFVNILEHI